MCGGVRQELCRVRMERGKRGLSGSVSLGSRLDAVGFLRLHTHVLSISVYIIVYSHKEDHEEVIKKIDKSLRSFTVKKIEK